MTRKLLVKIIASLYMTQGLWDIGVFLAPIFAFPNPINLNWFIIFVGIVEFRAGINLFKLNEFGRKFVIFLLYLRIAYNSFFTIWAFFQKDFSFVIGYFNKPFFTSNSVWTWAVTLIIWLLIALGTILFLSQRKTKMIFSSDTASEESSRLITESIPVKNGTES
jgi:hypothetical protein